MNRETSLVLLLTLLIVPSGCSKVGQAGRVIGKWLQKCPASPTVRPLKPKPVPTVVKKLEEHAAGPVAKVLPKPASPAKRQIAARKPQAPLRSLRSVAPATALRSAESLAQSQKLGQRLLGLRPKLPSVVYARLLNQWQRNHGEIEACQARLQDPSLDSYERENLEERLVTATGKNEEIERLMSQYG
ncbi:MAG: hypothetical protein ABFD16_10285 [Thermoguttaceae bacterium]|jgi:hypothetical protein